MADKIEWHPNGTPGPWEREVDNKVCRQISGELHAICTDQFCYAPEHEKETNARAIAEVPAMVQALRAAKQFIENGIEFGYIRMPDAEASDSAHDTLPAIRAILTRIDGEY